jgi:hypothetical protein
MLEGVDLASGCSRAPRRKAILHSSGGGDHGKEFVVSRNVSAASHRKNVRSQVSARLTSARFAGVTTAAAAVWAVAVFSTQSQSLRAGDEPRSQPKTPAASAKEPTALEAETERTLKRLHDEMATLAIEALAGLEGAEGVGGDVASQGLAVEAAKARYDYARLAREAAEIALKEYDAMSGQEKESREVDVKLAQAELEKAKEAIKPAKERLARIKQARKGRTVDLVNQWYYEGGVVSAQLQMRKTEFAVEAAQSKLKLFIDYERARRIKELRSDLEKARSGELANKATWDLEQSKLAKLKRMQDPKNNQSLLTAPRKRILALLDQAIPIEEQLGARLDQLKQANQAGDPNRKEVIDLTRQLQLIVDQAQGEQAAAALARLKSRLRRFADR